MLQLHGKVLVTAAGKDLARWAFNDTTMQYDKSPQTENVRELVLCGTILDNFVFLGTQAGSIVVSSPEQPPGTRLAARGRLDDDILTLYSFQRTSRGALVPLGQCRRT